MQGHPPVWRPALRVLNQGGVLHLNDGASRFVFVYLAGRSATDLTYVPVNGRLRNSTSTIWLGWVK